MYVHLVRRWQSWIPLSSTAVHQRPRTRLSVWLSSVREHITHQPAIQWCFGAAAGACGRETRWEPVSSVSRCGAIRLTNTPAIGARSAADPWNVGTEQPGSAKISSEAPGGSQNTRNGSRSPFALTSSRARSSIAVRDGPVGRAIETMPSELLGRSTHTRATVMLGLEEAHTNSVRSATDRLTVASTRSSHPGRERLPPPSSPSIPSSTSTSRSSRMASAREATASALGRPTSSSTKSWRTSRPP